MELGRATEAQAQYEAALQRAPRRALSMLGRAQAAAATGNVELARSIYAELDVMWSKADDDARHRLVAEVEKVAVR
jgi:thioredoxin-like negative regulator of GroEL